MPPNSRSSSRQAHAAAHGPTCECRAFEVDEVIAETNSQPDERGRVELTQTERHVLTVLTEDLPTTARMANPAAITEQIVFGRDQPVPENDDDLPAQEVYDRHEAALRSLEALGLVISSEVLGMTAYAATKAGADV